MISQFTATITHGIYTQTAGGYDAENAVKNACEDLVRHHLVNVKNVTSVNYTAGASHGSFWAKHNSGTEYSYNFSLKLTAHKPY